MQVIVVGGAVVDVVASPRGAQRIVPGSSNPGSVVLGFGGVARNIAEGIGRLGGRVALLSVVGADSQGTSLMQHAARAGVDTSLIKVVHPPHASASSASGAVSASSVSTATYVAVHDGNGELIAGIADMDIFKSEMSVSFLEESLRGPLRTAEVVVMDGNVSAEAFRRVAEMCVQGNIPIVFDGTSDVKCTLPITANALHMVNYMRECHCVQHHDDHMNALL